MRTKGFTMLEMLVAVAATLIMVLFLNQIFQSMAAAVGAGKSNSVILENSRVITPQLVKDTQEMVGPGDGGFLVIVNHVVAGPIDLAENAGQPLASVRSDQVMWVRKRANDEPLAPSDGPTFSSETKAQHIRVWYGHALRVNGDGTEPGTFTLGSAQPNQYAVRFVLGRQALFLDGTKPIPRTTVNTDPEYDDTYAVGAESRAGVSFLVAPPAVANPLEMFRGFTDICADDLDALTDAGGKLMPVYADIYKFIYADARLRVNTDPENTVEPWQVAQMHPYLSDGCWSFAVHFAGNYYDETADTAFTPYFTAMGVAPYNVAPDITPEIPWVDNDEPDPSKKNKVYPAGTVKWYTRPQYANTPGAATYNKNASVTFAVPTAAFGAPGSAMPGPVYDANPAAPYDNNVTAAFIFRNGEGAATNWPYLLRFQYRLIDGQARLSGGDGLPGRVFEQIVPVTR